MSKTLEERLAFLEKEYERLYHTEELLSIYIPRLTDILIKFWVADARYRKDVLRDLKNFQNLVGKFMDDLQEHYKAHFDEVKKRKEYIQKKAKSYKGVDIEA